MGVQITIWELKTLQHYHFKPPSITASSQHVTFLTLTYIWLYCQKPPLWDISFRH